MGTEGANALADCGRLRNPSMLELTCGAPAPIHCLLATGDAFVVGARGAVVPMKAYCAWPPWFAKYSGLDDSLNTRGWMTPLPSKSSSDHVLTL